MRCACCGSSSWRPNAWRFPAASWMISAGTGGSPPPPLALSLPVAPTWVLPPPPRPSSVSPPHSRVPLCSPASALHQSQVSALSPGLGSPSLSPGPSLPPGLGSPALPGPALLPWSQLIPNPRVLCTPGLDSFPDTGSHFVTRASLSSAPGSFAVPASALPSVPGSLFTLPPSLLVSDAPSVPELFLFLFLSVPPPWGSGIPHFYLY